MSGQGGGFEEQTTAPAVAMTLTSEGGQHLHNPDGSRKQKVVPHWVIWLAGVIVGGLFTTLAVAHQWADAQGRRDAKECEATVRFRDDNRAMWLYLVDTRGGQSDPEVLAAFVAELNARLPALVCDPGHHPIPVEP